VSYPLEGLRVLDMSRVLAGPFAGRMLCDLGADVVKVEPPEGDITRLWGTDVNGLKGYFHQQNVGKRAVCVDLRQAEAGRLITELAGQADVLIENFRPGVMERLGIGYPVLSASNSALVMLSISGFGQDSPEAGRAAYAPIIHAESGMVARQARKSGSALTDLAVSVADTNASLHGLVALLSALLMRERTGVGQHIDIAMIDSMLATDDGLHYALEGSEHTKMMSGEVWETVAGPVMIAGDLRYLWKQLTTICGVTDPTPEGASLDEKIAARRAATEQFFNNLPDRAAFIDAVGAMNLAWGDVRSSADIAEQPTVRHRGTLTQVDDRSGGRRSVVQSPYRFSAAESGVRGGAPRQGEHNAEVLKDWLGVDQAQIETWVDERVLIQQ
jgi:crotonobetainyl-CoA:carnitine CoA-transferase CaiB-like acyl-CoA transferase